MDFELRLATLSKLLDNPSEAVQRRLGEELRRVEGVLARSTDYGELEGALKVLAVLSPSFHGAVLPTLLGFVRTIKGRELTQNGEPMAAEWQGHRSASHLIREAIDVPNTVRYAHVEAMVDFLLELSRSEDPEVRDKAQSAFESLASFNLHYFSTLGARPQLAIVARLDQLPDEGLLAHRVAVLRGLRTVLSPAMEGQTWTYNAVTFTRGSVPSDGGVAEMRARAIHLLKRMYPIADAVEYRKEVLSVLNDAARRERDSVDAETQKMFERDALTVLDFMRELVPLEALWILQTIEHDAYWNYVHAASPEIEQSALAVRDALDERVEYKIYKQLIGFEGVLGKWENLRSHEEEWDYGNTKRLEAARDYVQEINADNEAEWRERILEYSKTESDDLAVFPVYYEFLGLLAELKPDLALELVRNHEARMRPFLIPLISGLRAGQRSDDTNAIVRRWIAEGTHLVAIAKSLSKGGTDRVDTLSALVRRAAELDDRDAVSIAMGVAANLYAQGCLPAKAVFLHGLRSMMQRNDGRWARVFWFIQDFKTLVAGMDAQERADVLASLGQLPALDYQTEELLRVIGEQDIDAVLGFLADRLAKETSVRAERRVEGRSVLDDKFEAIPYHLHALIKLLAQHPQELLVLVRRTINSEEARSMFPYRGGARLLKGVFPNFDVFLQAHLMKMLDKGAEADIQFVAAVVRAYGGGADVLDVCKAIIKSVEPDSSAWRELAAALETTGVVWGEYGFAQAFERKREELVAWTSDDNDRVKAFAKWLIERLERRIAFEKQRADEDVALRKYKFGVGNEES